MAAPQLLHRAVALTKRDGDVDVNDPFHFLDFNLFISL
jgi:hypothetical protein